MLPGLGGVFEGKHFQLNCEGWHELFDSAVARGLEDEIRAITVGPEQLRCGPVVTIPIRRRMNRRTVLKSFIRGM